MEPLFTQAIVLMHPNGVAGTTVIDGNRHYWSEDTENIIRVDKDGKIAIFPGHIQSNPHAQVFQAVCSTPDIPTRPMTALEIDQWCATRTAYAQPNTTNIQPIPWNLAFADFLARNKPPEPPTALGTSSHALARELLKHPDLPVELHVGSPNDSYISDAGDCSLQVGPIDVESMHLRGYPEQTAGDCIVLRGWMSSEEEPAGDELDDEEEEIA